jgi:hypothetical protein
MFNIYINYMKYYMKGITKDKCLAMDISTSFANEMILYCHIPKCSGTNTNEYLSKKFKDNYKWYIHRILQYDIHKYTDYYKFTIIRDPIERLVSLYFYQTNNIKIFKERGTLENFQGDNWNIISNLYNKYNINCINSFLDNYPRFFANEVKPYISNLKHINETKNMCEFYINGYLPQYLFICDNNFNILVDDIVNIENVESFMLNKFGIKMNKKKINIHTHTNDNYYKYLSEKNIKDIKEIYKEDYKYFSF